MRVTPSDQKFGRCKHGKHSQQCLSENAQIHQLTLLSDVINQQRTHSATVVCRCDGTVTLLACGVPNLSLDRLSIDLRGTEEQL